MVTKQRNIPANQKRSVPIRLSIEVFNLLEEIKVEDGYSNRTIVIETAVRQLAEKSIQLRNLRHAMKRREKSEREKARE
jgi:hypothetical protein